MPSINIRIAGSRVSVEDAALDSVDLEDFHANHANQHIKMAGMHKQAGAALPGAARGAHLQAASAHEAAEKSHTVASRAALSGGNASASTSAFHASAAAHTATAHAFSHGFSGGSGASKATPARRLK